MSYSNGTEPPVSGPLATFLELYIRTRSASSFVSHLRLSLVLNLMNFATEPLRSSVIFLGFG
jgi:hypothetical protein